MNIVFALPGLHRIGRGAEVALESVAQEIALSGKHQVTVIGSGEARSDRAYIFTRAPALSRTIFERWPKVPFLRNEFMYEELTFAANALLRPWATDADVTVTCGYPYTNWALRWSGAKNRTRHVFVTQNGDWCAARRGLDARFFNCDGLICTNPIYFERNRESWTAALIPNGVDTSKFHPGDRDRAQFGLPDDRPVVLMVSALDESKRVIEGVRAVANLENVHLVVAGDGRLRTEVQRLAAQLLPGRFTCRTFTRDEMPALYRTADVFLHAAVGESFGNVYIEALSSGVPVVAHDEGVTRWILGEYGLLSKLNSETEITSALRGALQTPPSPAEAHAAAEWARARYGWSQVAKQYAAFLEQIASARARDHADAHACAPEPHSHIL